ERVIAALQEMGPTFVKLGQLMSTRVDLFDPEWISAFESLQAKVSPLPFSILEATLNEAFIQPVAQIFDSIETKALASGSIAQVHRAVLNGENVVLKIQRPGIRGNIEADLRIMAFLAELAEGNIPSIARYTPSQIVRHFSTSMRRELDFSREARASERIRESFKDTDYVTIPKIYWEQTSPMVSTQEYIKGIPANDLSAIDSAGLDRHLLATRGVDAFLKMALEDGFFHADPHPGNFFYQEDNKLALIDFGLVGSLSDLRRRQLAQLLSGAVENNSQPVVDVLVDWAGDADIDIDALTSDIDALLEEYNGVNLAQVNIGIVFNQLTSLARDHMLTMPSELTILIKAVMILEGLGKRLSPDFDLVKEAGPFVRRAILQRYSPSSLLRRSLQSIMGIGGIIGELPKDFRRFLTLMRRGYIPININVQQLDDFSHRVERMINRTVIGLMVAALIVGSSIIMTVDAGPKFMDMPILGVLGFISANIGGTWVLLSMWFGRK
ncbi:MAG: ubiquinone biosynthesis protein UbiB, partial [Gammaproteobacteria bacterium]|nr:ubiquinone biosynthesis protein UbiB [Gammaproteobacteria bacterium]